MGQLENGVWTQAPLARLSGSGAFERPASVFRHWVTADGSPGPAGKGGFRAESGRYHLYVVQPEQRRSV